jgi:hypothetical protein
MSVEWIKHAFERLKAVKQNLILIVKGYGAPPRLAAFIRSVAVRQLKKQQTEAQSDETYDETKYECVIHTNLHSNTKHALSVFPILSQASSKCETFLDLGAKVGELLLETSLIRPGWRVIGVERRPSLQSSTDALRDVGCELAREWGLNRPEYNVHYTSPGEFMDSKEGKTVLGGDVPILAFAESVESNDKGL